MSDTDARTGRPYGDHGTAMQAIEFALDHLHVEHDTFLNSWREGDLDEWPEFYAWLAKQTPAPETHLAADIAGIREALTDESIASYPDFVAAVSLALDELERLRTEGQNNG